MEIRLLRRPDEFPLWAALGNAVHPDDPLSAADLEEFERLNLESVCFLAFDGGEAVGFGSAAREGRPLPDAEVAVLPAHRRRGIGSALLAEVFGWAAEREYRELETYVREVHRDGLEFAAHRGFVEIMRDSRVELDLTTVDTPAVDTPAGIELVTLADRPDLGPGLYDVYCEALPDDPGQDVYELEPLERWLDVELGAGYARPEATFIALGDGEPVGYARLAFLEAQPAAARHDLTGVKRAWRRRGIAGALKAAQIRWAKEAGLERLITTNEETNAPIRRLNERFGYLPVPGQVMLRGPVVA